MLNADVVIVGCGLSGAVLAERFASVLNRKATSSCSFSYYFLLFPINFNLK